MSSRNLSRREFLRGAAVGTLGVALAACAPTAAPAPAAAPAAAEEKAAEAAPAKVDGVVTVRFQTRCGAANQPTYEKVIKEDFESQFPNIKVSIEMATDDFTTKLLTAMVAGDAVDIFEAWGNIFYNWTQRDLLLDVQPFVDAKMSTEEIADYNDFQWKGLVMNGKRIGMPKYINIMSVTFNKDLFDKYGVEYPPEDGEWTHDDYAEMARKLTEGARKAGNDAQWGGWYPAWNWDRFWYQVETLGGQIVDQPYGTKCMLGTPDSQAALGWWYDIMYKQNYFAQPAQVENKWGDNALIPGLVCFEEDGTYPINRDRMIDGAFKYDIRHTPKGKDGKRKVLGTTDAWSITKQTKNPDASWELLHFLAGPIHQRKAVVGSEGIIPVLKSLIGSFIDDVRAIRPSLNEVRLETIKEILEWNYAEDTFWFKDQNCAAELITPALEKVFMVGDVGPEYFIEVAKQVDACQAAA